MQPPTEGDRQRGQILVIFALGLVAIIAMTGLVIDGGMTYVQRREQQNVADAAAMAGAYAYANSGDASTATSPAQDAAADNGYTERRGRRGPRRRHGGVSNGRRRSPST